MSKVLWHVTMSLDGFITGHGGDMSWLADHVGQNPTVDEVIGKIGAVLIGNRTFRGDDVNKGAGTEKGQAYGGAWSGPQFVLTHHAPHTPVPGFTFVGDLDSGVAAAKAAAGDKYVAILGPIPLSSTSTRACSTRSSCMSRPSCSATASGCSTVRAGPTSSSNASA